MTATVRVELHGATEADYQKLHVEMSGNFSRTIAADSGEVYRLPPAEYRYSGAKSRSDVADLAAAAAKRTGKNYSVLVTEAVGTTWIGLDKVQAKTAWSSLNV